MNISEFMNAKAEMNLQQKPFKSTLKLPSPAMGKTLEAIQEEDDKREST